MIARQRGAIVGQVHRIEVRRRPLKIGEVLGGDVADEEHAPSVA